MTETFDFGDGYGHRIGDQNCYAGWCGNEYPRPCESDGCDGLVHANFGDESDDGYWLDTECDKCHSSG